MLRGSFEISCQARSSSSNLQVATQQISLPAQSMRIDSLPPRPLGIPDSPWAENALVGCCGVGVSLILRHFLHEFSRTFKKRPSMDQIGRAEAFRELIINGLQQCQAFIAATLGLPEAHDIARRA